MVPWLQPWNPPLPAPRDRRDHPPDAGVHDPGRSARGGVPGRDLPVGTALQAATGQSGPLALTLSTLAVAGALQPLWCRIQVGVDRRFYRQAYDASRTLDTFAGRLRSQVELTAVQTDLLDAVRLTIHPSHASVWLREPGSR